MMGTEIVKLLILVVILMVVIRLLFTELDGKNAIRRMNLAYFLNFEKKFTYTKVKSTIITIVICFILFSGINIFNPGGLMLLAIFICIGMVADILSSYVYHLYGRRRYKHKIEEAKEYIHSIQRRIESPYMEDDIYVVEPHYDFTEVVNRYVYDRDHLACFSNDGGKWFSKLPKYSQVSFLIDAKEDVASARFENTPVRVTKLTSDKRYPFKDGKIDVLVCYNENFNPNEAKRVLKDGGTLILNQKGSENLIELYAFGDPRLFKNHWTLELCRTGLQGQNYQILSGDEYRGEIRFRSLAAFYHYVVDQALLRIDRIEDFVNQFFFIDQVIQKNGFFAMKTHQFYVVARKE